MITALLILFPLAAGVLTWFFKDKNAGRVALAASLIEFLISIFAFTGFESGSTAYLVNVPWISKLGINFYVDMDGISLLLVMLTTFLVPLIILSSFGRNYKNSGVFYSLILLMQGALVGVFVAKDAFLFYLFWELALIPIYFIALLWGGENKGKITFKFFLYTLFGSLFMLIGIIYIYLKTGPESYTFSLEAFYSVSLTAGEQLWLFWAFFLAFAIKMPIFPFHTWQPDTYTVAPTQGTMLLSGIMLKMGIYGVIRWLIPIVPGALHETWGGYIAIILSIVGIVYASVIAIMQKDYKRLIAYVSIAHVGLIAAGVLTMSFEGLQGAVIQMLSHGVNVVGLFFVLDIIFNRTNTRTLSELGGIRTVAPQFATYFVIILFSSIALPLTSGFIGEFLLFVGIFNYSSWLAAISGLSIILGAVYMLRSFQISMLGPLSEKTKVFTDVSISEKAVLVPIVILIFWIGLYPKTFMDVSEPAVNSIIDQINTTYTLK